MNFPVHNAGQYGLIVDRPVESLPFNAWTAARNIRFRDGKAEKFLGNSQSYGALQNAPYWLLPVNTGASQFWLYAGLAKVGALDGSSHADITRTSGGDYSMDLDIGWSGTIIEGIPVITNGIDAPQMWNTPDLGTPLAALSNWPAGVTCRSIRGLKRYLVALDITKSGTRYPFMIKWGDQAPANGLPASWDETDETIDAAEYTLPGEGGFVIDAFPLRDSLIIYKEYQTWLMQYVGGIDIFRFAKIFDSFGSFTRRCAAEFFSGRQVVFTGDDIVLHDGQQAKSLLDERGRRLVRSQVDTVAYLRSFVVVNYSAQEVWVCFPEAGNSLPNKALVWNWRDNTFGVRDLPQAAFIASGIVNPIEATETWSGAVGDWSTDAAAWGDRSFDPSQRALLMALPGDSTLHLMDSTNQFAGQNMTVQLERTGLGFPLKKEQPPDFETMKMLDKVWPHLSGQAGATINVYIGAQDSINGPVSWSPAQPFIVGQSEFIDYPLAGRLHALRFESSSDDFWQLHGYSVDIRAMGGR